MCTAATTLRVETGCMQNLVSSTIQENDSFVQKAFESLIYFAIQTKPPYHAWLPTMVLSKTPPDNRKKDPPHSDKTPIDWFILQIQVANARRVQHSSTLPKISAFLPSSDSETKDLSHSNDLVWTGSVDSFTRPDDYVTGELLSQEPTLQYIDKPSYMSVDP